MASTKKTAKKSTAHKQTSKKKVAAKQDPFFTFEPTLQSIYWIILGFIILFFAIWIIRLQVQISDIYNAIEANQADTPIILKKK